MIQLRENSIASHGCVYLKVFFLLELTTAGFVSKVSTVSPSKDRKRCYFEFTLQAVDKCHRVICFSPEKHKLVSKLANSDKETGIEIKKFRANDKDEILIGDYSSVKRTTLHYQKKEPSISYVTIEEVINECMLHDVVNVRGMVYDLGPTEEVLKDGTTIKLKKACLKDCNDEIPITIFGDHDVENNTTYRFTQLRVGKYSTQRLLKTTPLTTITKDSNQIQWDINDLSNITNNEIEGIIVSVNISSFDAKRLCPNRKIEVVQDGDIIICSACSCMVAADDYRQVMDIIFTVSDSNVKLDFSTTYDNLQKVFNINDKKQLAKTMLHSKVIIKYDMTDNKVLEMKKREA